MTIKKKIAAVAAAAMITASMTAISAFAVSNPFVYNSHEVGGHSFYYSLEADVPNFTQTARSRYLNSSNGNPLAEVRVHLHVDDYYSGVLISSDNGEDSGIDPDAYANCFVTASRVSLFSSHEIYPDGLDGWGDYLSLSGVVQPDE